VSDIDQEILDHLNDDMAEMDNGPTAQAAIQRAAAEAKRQQRESLIRELSALSPMEYDQRRRQEAARLGARVSTLDAEVAQARRGGSSHTAPTNTPIIPDVEPWQVPVDGAALLDEMVSAFTRFVVLPDLAAVAMALWVIHTYCLDAADVIPRLAFTSPEKRCGKTIAMGMLGHLVARPLPASNISSASVYRAIEAFHPTLLIDEADTFLQKNEELRGVINSGHSRHNAHVIRTAGDNHETVTFSTWAPIAIAQIGKLPGTIEDRSIEVRMRRRHPGEKVEKFRRQHRAGLPILARKVARWAADNLSSLIGYEPAIPETLNDRAGDNWEPLLAIADRIGGGTPARARDAALQLSGERPDDSIGEMVLSDLRDMFIERGVDRLTSKEICAALAEDETRPWHEYRHAKPITQAQLARLLKRYGIHPDSVRVGDKTPKGYKRSDFDDAFQRYLSPFQAATPQQPNGEKEISDSGSRNTAGDVAVPETSENPTGTGDVAPLRPGEGVSGGTTSNCMPEQPGNNPPADSSRANSIPCQYFMGSHLLGAPCTRCGRRFADHFRTYG
jgi:putative DNA primase/helicase